ncbi:MAG: hypothetical protein M9932_00705 [Xanthobacteraceae bacterium]|nr:hypothetical protein [Xanthobacteraceae bacterium]
MSTKIVYTRGIGGPVVTDDEATDEKGLLRDGFAIRVPVMLADGAPRSMAMTARHYLMDVPPSDDAMRREKLLDAYEARDRRLMDAWKDAAPAAQPARTSTGDGDRIAAYERRDARLANAWRNPV